MYNYYARALSLEYATNNYHLWSMLSSDSWVLSSECPPPMPIQALASSCPPRTLSSWRHWHVLRLNVILPIIRVTLILLIRSLTLSGGFLIWVRARGTLRGVWDCCMARALSCAPGPACCSSSGRPCAMHTRKLESGLRLESRHVILLLSFNLQFTNYKLVITIYNLVIYYLVFLQNFKVLKAY